MQAVKHLIHTILVEELSGKIYSQQDAKIWTTNIANIINNKVRGSMSIKIKLGYIFYE